MDSIIIYNSIGTVLYENIPVTSSAELVQELMRSDYIQLSWNSATNETIPAGAYIIYGTEYYSLLEPYSPDQKNEREWEYKPQFVSQFFRGSKAPFFMYSTSGGVTTKEADWTLTDNPANFMERVLTAFLNELGLKYHYAVDNNLQNASATLQFNCVDIITACNSIANAFETELWLEKFDEVDSGGYIGRLHLGKAALGTAKVLEVGNNIKVPSKTNNAEFFNRFYVFGSSRNITQAYQGAAVNNLATKRLTLNPTTYPNGYMDFSNGGPVYSKILQFDGVYPSATDLVVMNIRPRTRYVLDENTSKPIVIGVDEDDKPIYDTYAIWYVQLKRLVDGAYVDFQFNNTTYDKDDNPDGMLLPGLVPSIHFNSGPLAGREFEVIYHEQEKTVQDSADTTPFTILAGDFEIKYQDENGFILPAMTGLVPQTDNLVVLFNVRMPDSYIESAQDRLAVVALEEINKNYLNTTTGEVVDKNEYQAASDPTVFYTNDPGLVLGGKVLYKNGSYQKETRVTALTKRLDLPCYQNIVFGDEIIKGNIEELKEEAVSANKNIDLLAAISKSTNDITAAYERTHQLILKQLAEQGSFWLEYEQTIDGVTHRSVKLNPVYEGVWAEGFGSFGGIGSGGGGGGGADLLSMWVSLKNNNDDYANCLINAHHLPLGNGLSIDPETGLINVSNVGGVASVAGVLPVNGDVQKAALQTTLGIDVLGTAVQSLQSQIDSVASRDMYDELTATSLFAEIAAVQSLHAEILSAKNIDLNGLSLTNTNGVLSMNGNALLSALTNEGNNIAITVGGKKLTLEVGYAKKALGDKNGNDIYATYVSGIAIGTDTQKDNVLVSKAGTTTALTIPYATVSPNTRFTYTIGSTTYADVEFPVDWFISEEYESGKYRLRLNPKYEGLYSDGWLTAGGVGSHSGGGGGGVVEQLYRFSDLGGSFDDATNDAFNAYTVNALYLRIVALESRPTGGVTSVAGMVGDVTTASLASALGITNLNNNLSTISECIQSLQSQIDAVATRDRFDELTATAAFADVLSASAIHVESLSLDGSDLAGSLSALCSRATSLEGRASSLESRATSLESRATSLEGKFTGDSANSALRLTTVSKTAWGQTYWTSGGVPDSISGNMSSVGSISMNGSISGVTSITASGLIKTTNYVQATRFYLTDSIYFVADSNGVKLEGAGFYTDSFVTAGGVGSGGSGGDMDVDRLWQSLQNNPADQGYEDALIAPAHIPDMAATYGYLKSITSAMVVSALGYTPFSSASFTKANIQSTLGISAWALDASKPTYSVSEIIGLQSALDAIRANAAHGETAYNSLSTVSDVLQSLQSQIDSVASRDCFDELTASVFHSDMVAVSDLYAKAISLNGADLATSLSGLSTAIANEATARANAIAAEVTARNTAIANAVNALDSATEAVSSGYFLTGITITDGKITGRAQANSISGNAATATRLADNNTHYLWGVSYWASGVPQDVTAAPNLYIARTKVRASAANDTLLGVTAISNASSSGSTGDETRIEWDATNHAWHFYGGIYADTFVVAGGAGSSGGGSDIDLDRVWESLTNNTDFQDVEINPAHIPGIAWGKITSGKPTTLVGYGITDARFGTEGADYVPITLGTTTKNVLTAHQSLSGYATETWVGQQGFITKAVNDLTNYYTKTQTYTRAEVNDLIGSINQFHYEIAASTGAVTDPQSNVLYLIGPTGSGSDKYEEYVYTTQWVKIGDTSIDLTPYLTKTLAAQTYQPIISDLESIISNAAHGEAAYNSLTTVSAILQSLQSQVDSVASRDTFDELTATVFYSDVAAVSDLYVGAVSLNGVDLAGSLSSLASRATSLESRATALEGRATSLESRASTLESYFTNGVANSALRLSGTATYSIWGVEYWSSGVPKSVTGRPGLYIGTTQVQTSATSQDLNGIAAINASGLATIAGGIKLTTTKKIYFGDTEHYLELDSNGFHFSHGVYSEDFVTAGGIGSGGSGGDMDVDRMWQSLTNNPADQGYENTKIAIAHIPDVAATYGYLKGNQTITLTGVVTGIGTTSITTSIADGALSISKVSGLQAALDSKTGNTGTVTSVGLSVPTGLSVSGSPITTSGTLAITFASGYSIPTTAQQSAWSGKQDAIIDLPDIRTNAANGNTAYSWGNHANAGYLLASVAAETYATITALGTKQDIISDLTTIRSNASAGATAYGWGNHTSAGYLTSANGTTISQALQSLQGQIDSVASRDMFDELSATVLHSDIVTASNAYFDAITAASANIASITGSLSGNATTASYLVSASYGIGGGLNPIYFSGGRPVASTSTAGSASVPVYLNGGTLTAITPSSLFSALSSSAATNLSVTIAGQVRTIADLYARYDKDGGEIATNMTTIGTALRSLQSQVDSVASRDRFDELNATVLFTDMLSVGGDTHIGGKIWFDSTHYIEIINGYLHTNLPIVSDSYITAGA